MRTFLVAAVLIAVGVPATALAQTPQVAPVRVEFTRPGGTPGAARATILSSEYMLAPAQPGSIVAPKRRKHR
jgi:hypothetical protein